MCVSEPLSFHCDLQLSSVAHFFKSCHFEFDNLSRCLSGLMSSLSAGSEMQASALDPQFIPGPQGKVPGRKRGRPPIRKLEFQSHYVETLSPLKVPKKRGRKPGFKVSLIF